MAEHPQLPPGPRLPAYVQSLLIVAFPLQFFRGCRKRFGDVFTVRSFFQGTVVMVCDPRAIKQVFTAPTDVLRAGQANSSVLSGVLGDFSVLTLDGREHLRQRRLLLPPFHGERMRAYERIMAEATHRAIERWPVGRPFRLLGEMQQLTLEIILRTVFGTAPGEREDELRDALREMLQPMTNRGRLVLFALSGGRVGDPVAAAAFRRRLARVDALLYAEIARRRADPELVEREDVCALLLQATDEDGRPMRDVEIRDELMTLLIAGHETTSTALAWAFERVLRHDGVRALLERELGEGDVSYLDAVVKETLRIRNVLVNVARAVTEPYEIGGHLLPAGVTVMPSISMTHRRADDFPQPLSFRPERFLDGGADTYTWIPFGGGPRRCLGASFALFEMRTVIRAVLERTDLRAVGSRSEPIKRSGITMVPGRGARVIQPAPPRARARAVAEGEQAGVPA